MNYGYIDTKKVQEQPSTSQTGNDKVAELIGKKPSIVSTGVIRDIEIETKKNSSIDEKKLLSIIEKELEIAELDSLLKEVDKAVGEDFNTPPEDSLLADTDVLINNGGNGGLIFGGGAFASKPIPNNILMADADVLINKGGNGGLIFGGGAFASKPIPNNILMADADVLTKRGRTGRVIFTGGA